MADFSITITSSSQYEYETFEVFYSTSMSAPSPSSTMQIGDRLLVDYQKQSGGQNYVTLTGIDTSLWNTSNTQETIYDGQTVILTASAAGIDQLVADFPGWQFQDQNRNVTIQGPSVTAPTVSDTMSTHTVAGTTSSTTTVDINLTANGSGGTLQYNVSTTTTVPTSGWTTGNPSVTRGTGYYLWARQDSSNYDRSASKLTIPYIAADSSVTATWPSGTLASSATTFTVGIASGSSATTYSVRTGSYSGTVVGSRKGNGNISVSDTPAAGSSKTYYLTAHVATADGGNASASNAGTESVSKAAAGSSQAQGGGSADYGVEIFDASGTKTMSVGDTLAFIVGTTTISVPNSGSSTGNVTGTMTGLKTTDTLFAKVDTSDRHALEIEITSNGNFSVDYTRVRGSTSGNSTYTLIGVNKGD